MVLAQVNMQLIEYELACLLRGERHKSELQTNERARD